MSKDIRLLLKAVLFSTLFFNGVVCEAQPQVERSRRKGLIWRVATYRGLIVSKSSRSDMLRMFGKPKRRDIPEGQRSTDPYQEVWYIYNGIGEFPGDFTVMVNKRSGKIVEMYLSPKDLSKEEAIKHFGENYIITRYDFCPGFEDEDAGPIYESPDGAASYIEYRDRGIALLVNYMGKVDNILYVSKPIGLASRKMCRQELEK